MDELKYDATTEKDDRLNVHGVLLCDEIYHYCKSDTQLISQDTFNAAMLRPAGYDLRLGPLYYAQAKLGRLSEANPLLVLRPYELVVASTFERLNMPRYLIGRWNLRVTLVYRGLLLVTGMQVDPGFQGNLFYTLFNFSTREVQLKYKEEIAMIDFVKATRFDQTQMETFFKEKEKEEGVKIRWKFEQTKSNLEDYLPPYELRSAPEELDERSKRTETKMDTFQRTITTVLTIMIGVIAVLVAIGAIFTTQIPTESKIRAVVEKILEEKARESPAEPTQSQSPR